MGGEYVNTAINESLPLTLREMLDASSDVNTLARFVYYLWAITESASRHCASNSELIVFDRYLYSTLSAHLAMAKLNGNVPALKAISDAKSEILDKTTTPDLVVFLYVGAQERKARLLGRSGNNHLDYDYELAELTQEKFRKMAHELKFDRKVQVLEIDTTGVSKEEVLDKVKLSVKALTIVRAKGLVRV